MVISREFYGKMGPWGHGIDERQLWLGFVAYNLPSGK